MCGPGAGPGRTFRLFKLGPNDGPVHLERTFSPSARAPARPGTRTRGSSRPPITVTVLFDPAGAAGGWWRSTVQTSFTATPDGRLRVTVGTFPDEDSVLSWLLTFGDGAELLEPPALRTRLRQLGEALARQYQ